MRSVIAICLIVGGTLAAAAAADDYEIQGSSNAPGHPVGQKMPKGTRINLPEGATINFIDRTKGVVTRQCGGKYEGPIESCKPAAGSGSPTSPGAARGITMPDKKP